MTTNYNTISTQENTNCFLHSEKFIPLFKNVATLQNKVLSHFVAFDTANDSTQRVITHNAIYIMVIL